MRVARRWKDPARATAVMVPSPAACSDYGVELPEHRSRHPWFVGAASTGFAERPDRPGKWDDGEAELPAVNPRRHRAGRDANRRWHRTAAHPWRRTCQNSTRFPPVRLRPTSPSTDGRFDSFPTTVAVRRGEDEQRVLGVSWRLEE